MPSDACRDDRWGHEKWQQELLEAITAIIPENLTCEITVNCSAGIAVDLSLGKIRVLKK